MQQIRRFGDVFCLTQLVPKFLMKYRKSLSRSSFLLESFPHLHGFRKVSQQLLP